MSLGYGLCMLRFKHFVELRGKKFDTLQNVYIPADCQSWRQLSINPCLFAGKELEVNGLPLFDLTSAKRISVVRVVHLATKSKSTYVIKLSLLARTVSRLLEVDFLAFSA